MFYMYEAIIITKILMQVLQPKNAWRYKGNYVLLLPLPGMNAIYVLCKQQ